MALPLRLRLLPNVEVEEELKPTLFNLPAKENINLWKREAKEKREETPKQRFDELYPDRPEVEDKLQKRVNEEYTRLQRAETAGEKDPWIRTREIPKEGSSAYGPVQLTKGLAELTLKAGYFKDNPEVEKWIKNKFIPHGFRLLKHGKMEGKIPDYDSRFDYGGAGDFNEQDKRMYERANKIILCKELEKNPDLDIPKYWRGKEPEESYRERYNAPLLRLLQEAYYPSIRWIYVHKIRFTCSL